MLAEQYRAFARYNTWMNQKLYALARELDDETRKRDLGAFFGSIHGTFNHILLADRFWMGRFTGDSSRFTSRDAAGEPIAISGLDHELYESFDELERERALSDADIQGWADSLSDEQLAAPLTYETSKGETHSHPMWNAVAHFFNHQTHHRGQITTLLYQQGLDPGVTDLAVFLRGAS